MGRRYGFERLARVALLGLLAALAGCSGPSDPRAPDGVGGDSGAGGDAGQAGAATVNHCPVIDSVTATSNEVTLGKITSLSAQAHDPDDDRLRFTWSTSSGDLGDASAAHTVFACAASGSVTLTLTVTDADDSSDCQEQATLVLSCVEPPPEASEPQDDPAALSETAAVLKSFAQAKADDPAAISDANDALRAELSDDDALDLMTALRVLLELREGRAIDESMLDLDHFLLRHRDVGFLAQLPLEDVAAEPSPPSAARHPAESHTFLPRCAPPSCFDQALLFASKGASADALLAALLSGLSGMRDADWDCLTQHDCGADGFLTLAGSLSAVGAPAPLEAVLAIVAATKVRHQARATYEGAAQRCDDFQRDPTCE